MTDFLSDRIIQLRSIAIAQRKKALEKLAVPASVPEEFKPGSFRKNFEKKNGQAREDYVYQYVTRGLVPKPKLVPITVKDPSNPSISMTYDVMPDYFSIEGMPVQVTPVTAEKIARHFGLNLPTNTMTKQVYANAKNKIPGKPNPGRLGTDSGKLVQYNDEIAQARKNNKNFDPNGITVGEYKELELKHDGNNLHATGLLKDDGKTMWQDFRGSTAHPEDYVDYSHAFRPAGNFTFTDDTGKKVTISFDQLVNDPKYKKYASLVADPGKSYQSYLAPKEKTQTQKTPYTPAPAANGKEQMMERYDQFLDELGKGVV